MNCWCRIRVKGATALCTCLWLVLNFQQMLNLFSLLGHSQIYQRTQDLIRSSARSFSGNSTSPVSTSLPMNISLTTQQSFQTPPMINMTDTADSRKRPHQTGHPWRLKPGSNQNNKKKKAVAVTEKTYYRYLLDRPYEEEEEDSEIYPYQDNQVLMRGYATLRSDMDDIYIRHTLLETFNAKFPTLTEFEYIKRDRQSLSVPVTPPGWEWNYANLRGLVGQGKVLYCRVLKPMKDTIKDANKEPLHDEIENDEDTDFLPSALHGHSHNDIQSTPSSSKTKVS